MSFLDWKTARCAWGLAAALACAGAQAQVEIAQSVLPAVGETVTLDWFDRGIAVGGDGHTDTTIVVGFDASVFSFVSAAAGNAFSATSVLAPAQAVELDFGGGTPVPALQFLVVGDGQAAPAAGQQVFSLTLQLLDASASADHTVYFIDPLPGQGVATYYNFESFGVAVAVVPEPATAASLLAGLALLAGVAGRRARRAAASAL